MIVKMIKNLEMEDGENAQTEWRKGKNQLTKT